MARPVLMSAVMAAACGSSAPVTPEAPVGHEASRASPVTAGVYVKVFDGLFTPLRCLQDGVALDACAAPAIGAELRDEDDVRWRVTGTAEDECGFGLVDVTATAGPHREADVDRVELAVSPPDADLRVRRGADATVEADEDTRAAIARVVAYAGDPATISVDQTLEADLDGDGTRDRLYVAHGEHEVDGEDERFEAIVYLPRGDPAAAIRVVATDRDDDSYSIGGTFDLEGDGRLELYYVFRDDEHLAVGVVSFVDGVPTEVNRTWVC